jgi:hypothetical protein
MNDGYKEVYFREYCPRCKFKERKEEQVPCCYCLEAPFNYASHKPEKFEEADR